MNIQDFIKQHEPLDNTSSRLNCPECGGRNTFTITKEYGKLLWNCYKASCRIKGAKGVTRTKDDIKSLVSSQNYHSIHLAVVSGGN